MARRFVLLMLLAGLFLAVPAQAQSPGEATPAWVAGFGFPWFQTLSPDGTTLAVSATGGLFVFDTAQPDVPALRLDGHTDTVRSVAFSPDGILLASASLDGSVRLWRLPDGAPLWSAPISAACCDAAAPLALTFSQDAALLYVVASTPYSPGPLLPSAINTRSGQVQALDDRFAPRLVGDELLIPVDDGGTPVVRALRAEGDGFQTRDLVRLEGVSLTDQARFRLTEGYAFVTGLAQGLAYAPLTSEGSVAWIADLPGALLSYQDTLFADAGERLTVFSLATGARVDLTKQPVGGWHDGGDWYLFVDETGMLTGLDLVHLRMTPITRDPVTYWLSNGVLMIASAGGVPRLVDLASGSSHEIDGETFPTDDPQARFHVQGTTAFVAYGSGPGYQGTRVGLWDVTSGQALIAPQTYDSLYADFVADGAQVALSARRDQASGLLVADLASPGLTWTPVDGYANPLVFGTAGLLYDAPHGGLARLDAAGESVRLAFEGHTTYLNDVVYSPDGARIATASEDLTVRLWDATSGAPLDVLRLDSAPKRLAYAGEHLIILGADGALRDGQGAPLPVEGLPDSPADLATQGTHLAVAGGSGASLFDVDAAGGLTLRATLTAGADLPPITDYRAVALDPAGHYVAAAGNTAEAGAIDLWDAASGAFVARLDGWVRGDVIDLAFNTDGSQLALTAGSTLVWNLAASRTEPSYGTAYEHAVASAFAGERLIAVQQNCWANTLHLLDSDDTPAQSLQRRANRLSGGCGGAVYYPIAVSPDGGQLAVADPGGLLVTWAIPDSPSASAPDVADAPAEVSAYCNALGGPPEGLTADRPITIVWSWYASEPVLLFDHLWNVTYELTLDGQPLDLQAVQPGPIRRDPVNNNAWTLHYGLTVGTLASGEHQIDYRATWRQAISDGVEDYGPGTARPEDRGTCHLTLP